jgi:two-component system alkaline phosphatase synthesis response regulator PhoP
MAKIALVTSFPKEFNDLRIRLSSSGHELLTFAASDKTRSQLSVEWFDVLVIDWESTGTSLAELLQVNREEGALSHPYIIVVSEKAEDELQAFTLNEGADVYMVKPLKPTLVLAVLTALMKRTKKRKTDPGGLIINFDDHQVYINSQRIELSLKEFKVLSLLHSNPRKVFSKKEIALRIWNNEEVVLRRVIDVHIKNIRQKIGRTYIRTIKGVGYLFNPA